ncbi:hypothetical protein DPEC_G00074320 [Dallia pectoralis]|uniref:Uncharacterized protein n=1 Tax=Dallia pectoralis TaxID=75939 RepID=A0ACC2H3A5_DALPE|nr:hypothetical protein DPEC_G00074320 [Dallia pectoralis]
MIDNVFDLGPGLLRDGKNYIDEEMKRALFGVKRMKEVMEKNQEKHGYLMKALKESKNKRKGAVQLATEAELVLQEAEEQCIDSLRKSFKECRPCLEDTCKTFYTSTCRRGFSSFSLKVEEFFQKLSAQMETPDQVVNKNHFNHTENSGADLELVQLNASFGRLVWKMGSLYNRSTELVNKMHQEFGQGFWIAFNTKLKPNPLSPTQESPGGIFFQSISRQGRIGLDDVLEEVYDIGRAVMEDFSDLIKDVMDNVQEAIDRESHNERECPSVRELHSELERTYLLLNESRLQYEELLQMVQKHTDDTNAWLNNMEAKYGWVTHLPNSTQRIFGVVAQERADGTPGDTRVVVSVLDSPPITITVPAEVPDDTFIQYVAQKALAHYKQTIEDTEIPEDVEDVLFKP